MDKRIKHVDVFLSLYSTNSFFQITYMYNIVKYVVVSIKR